MLSQQEESGQYTLEGSQDSSPALLPTSRDFLRPDLEPSILRLKGRVFWGSKGRCTSTLAQHPPPPFLLFLPASLKGRLETCLHMWCWAGRSEGFSGNDSGPPSWQAAASPRPAGAPVGASSTSCSLAYMPSSQHTKVQSITGKGASAC